MSDPYAYTPSANYQYPNEYHQTAYYQHTPRAHTPFLPPSPSLRSVPGSPRFPPGSPRFPPRPVTPTSSRIPFPSSTYNPDVSFPPWNTSPRQRPPSWHGQPTSSDSLYPGYPPFQEGGSYPRRNSFNSRNPPLQSQFNPAPWSAPPFSHASEPSPHHFSFNPFINAANPRQDFFLDLALNTFSPIRFFGPGQSSHLSLEELREPATHPPITRLQIICDLIPQWPIDLELRISQSNPTPYNPYAPNEFGQQQQLAPITLGDVLLAIHQAMHRRISHADWAQLSRHEEKLITQVYKKRCAGDEYQKAQGVKRVDFLVGKTRMVGLVREGVDDGVDVARLVLEGRP